MAFYSCIEEFTPVGINQISGLLVVDGLIAEDTTVLVLSRSVELQEDWDSSIYINHALIYVQGDDGSSTSKGVYIGDGKYQIETGKLNPDIGYRLFITLDDKEYVTDYRKPLFTPGIDEFTWKKEGRRQPVSIIITTHDPKDQSRYYKWSYKEQWEVKSEFFASITYDESIEDFVHHSLGSSNNFYYCWSKGKSNTLILGDIHNLSENLVYRHSILDIESSEEKLSVLYYIEIEQVQMRKDAYVYFNNLLKNIKGPGGIFSIMPTEIHGNITCLTHPEEVVIGFVEVATVTRKNQFISASEVYEPIYSTYCEDFINHPTFDGVNYFVYEYNPERGYNRTHRTCFDCRTFSTEGKKRPPFWPNDHY